MTVQIPIKLRAAGALGQFEPGDQIAPNIIAGLMGRNRIINGNFDFWQRGVSIGAGTTGVRYLADRFYSFSQTSTYAASQQAFAPGQTDVPGNPKFYHRTVVTANAAASALCVLAQAVEDVSTFAGQTVTLTFYAKASASLSVAVDIQQDFGTGGSSVVSGLVGQKRAIGTAWQKLTFTVTLPSVAGKTLGTNNTLRLYIYFDAGSNFDSSTGALGHQSGTFDIALVQFEAGDVATVFEDRPLALELMLCQRFFEKSYDTTVNPGTVITGGASRIHIENLGSATRLGLIPFTYKVTKRATPAVTLYSPVTGASGKVRDVWNNADLNGSLTYDNTNNASALATTTVANTTLDLAAHWAADAEL